MDDNPPGARAAAPWHLWLVGVIFLCLYGIGTYDYIETRAGNTAYFEAQGYGAEQIEYFTDYPVVPLVFWTVNIVAGLVAVALLFLKSRWAAQAAATAALSQVCLQVITFGFMDRWNVLGPRLSIPDIIVMLLTFVLWYYCVRLRRKNVLK